MYQTQKNKLYKCNINIYFFTAKSLDIYKSICIYPNTPPAIPHIAAAISKNPDQPSITLS